MVVNDIQNRLRSMGLDPSKCKIVHNDDGTVDIVESEPNSLEQCHTKIKCSNDCILTKDLTPSKK